MRKVPLGLSNMKVSTFCLGTMYFGTKVAKEDAFRILDLFLENGGNFIDTANNYAWWIGGSGDESELIIGEWLKQRGVREHIVLASKVGSRPVDLSNGNTNREGLNSKTIINAVEDSLIRLRTDYLDLCYFHADLQEYPMYERLEAFEKLIEQGKMRAKGGSNITLSRLKELYELNDDLDYSPLVAIQQKFSYLLPSSVDEKSVLKFLSNDMLDFAETKNVAVLIYSVLLSGAYERPYSELPQEYKSPVNFEKFEHLKNLSLELGCSRSQLVLAKMLERSQSLVPLVACSSINQLEHNLEALTIKLP